MVTKHTHTQVCLPLHSIWAHVCVCLWERRRFSLWNPNIPIPSSPLFAQPSCLIYLSLLSQTLERSLQLRSRLHPHVCTHRPLWTPVLSGSLCFSHFSSLKLKPLLHLCFSPLLVFWETLWGIKEVCLNVLAVCDVISCCSLWQRLRFAFEAKGFSWRCVWWLLTSLSFTHFHPSVQQQTSREIPN